MLVADWFRFQLEDARVVDNSDFDGAKWRCADEFAKFWDGPEGVAARAVLKERKKTITIGKEEWTGGWHTFVLDGQGHTDYSDGGSRSNPLTAFGIVSLWLVQDASRKPSDFMPWLDAELAKAKSPRPWWKWWG